MSLATVFWTIVGYFVVMAIILFLIVGHAQAHSWYPSECCSGQDCAEVIAGKLPNIQTKLGGGTVTEQTKRLESKDNKLHACIRGGKVVCIFFPPQM